MRRSSAARSTSWAMPITISPHDIVAKRSCFTAILTLLLNAMKRILASLLVFFCTTVSARGNWTSPGLSPSQQRWWYGFLLFVFAVAYINALVKDPKSTIALSLTFVGMVSAYFGSLYLLHEEFGVWGSVAIGVALASAIFKICDYFLPSEKK